MANFQRFLLLDPAAALPPRAPFITEELAECNASELASVSWLISSSGIPRVKTCALYSNRSAFGVGLTFFWSERERERGKLYSRVLVLNPGCKFKMSSL